MSALVDDTIRIALAELAELGRTCGALGNAFERARTSQDPCHLLDLGDALQVGSDPRAHLLAAAARERAAWRADRPRARAYWRTEAERLAAVVAASHYLGRLS